MLYFDKIDVSEGVDVNKISASKECDICLYWYFLNFSFKFQPNVCNTCHVLRTMSVNLSDTAVSNMKGSSLISKNNAINLMENADLTEKKRNIININNLVSYIKMGKEILTFGNTEIGKNKLYHHKTLIFLEM